jgi:heterotetrameric sarcosine oxidase gamma subunit
MADQSHDTEITHIPAVTRLRVGQPQKPGLNDRPGALVGTGDFELLHPWADAWLAVSQTLDADGLRVAIETVFPNSMPNDLSDAYETIGVTGTCAIDVLAAGCAIDFGLAAPQFAVATRLGHFDIVLVRRSPVWFDVHVPRSYFVDCLSWLQDSQRSAVAFSRREGQKA